jgi:iron complex outermembrane receptor protein
MPLSNGDRLTLTAGYNYNDTVVTYFKGTPSNVLTLSGGTPIFDRQSILRYERGAPLNKAVLSQTYDLGKLFTFMVREDWYGKVLAAGSVTGANQPTTIGAVSTDQWLNPKWLIDVEATWKITRHLKFSVGADNLFNTYPTKLDAANNTSGLSQYSSFSPFGFDGGYYFGQLEVKF